MATTIPPVLTASVLGTAAMREADRRCIEGLGIPGAVLMNNAGAAVFREIERGPVGVVCGKGNNGGDGFVVARLALLAGMDVHAVLLAEPGEIVGDAAAFMRAYLKLGGALTIALESADVVRAVVALECCTTMVDAILGTGVAGSVRGAAKAAIEAWPNGVRANGVRTNAIRPNAVRTIAVDLPSGMNADTGEPCGACIHADTTVTFQFSKAGFGRPGAADYLGRLVVADIGIPSVCADDAAWERLKATWPDGA